MSDGFYGVVVALGRPIFWASSRPVVVGAEHVPRQGACLVASTHQSPYDIPILMRHAGRALDFVSVVEVFRNPLVGWFYGSLNAFPLDRSRPDSRTVRVILERLRRGRAVGMFPEGRLRPEAESVVRTREIRAGIGRIACLSGAPVVPCVIVNSGAYRRPASWLPLRRTRYGVIFGAPIGPAPGADEVERRLVDAFVALHARLVAVLGS